MCGIAGFVGELNKTNLLNTMLDRIVHRGPDGRGTWLSPDGSVSFGHVRLSIIDLHERAAQPMECVVSGNVITYNGEIYNYSELRQALGNEYPFRTMSDTEVVLAAWTKWGGACLDRFRGMFAFALWERAHNRVHLVRDRFGVKPLYFRVCNSSVIFASEIKALVRHADWKDSVNVPRVAEFLAHRYLDTGSETLFREVDQILPGGRAVIEVAQPEVHSDIWWQLELTPEHDLSNNEATGRLGEVLADSVSAHLVSDVGVGAFVSGGLDSSTIACLASMEGTGGRDEYSVVLDRKDSNEENNLIPEVHSWNNANAHDLHISQCDFGSTLNKVIFHHDEPFGDASMFAHYELCRMVRSTGVKVVLSGNGGDEMLGGYRAHLYSYLGLVLRQKGLGELRRTIRELVPSGDEKGVTLFLRALQEAAPGWLRHQVMVGRLWKCTTQMTLDLDVAQLNNDFDKEADPWITNYHNCIRHWTLPPFLHYEDRNSMAHGIEVRVPFVDHQVYNFCASLDPKVLVGTGRKGLLRTAMSGKAPSSVLEQKAKLGFPAPLARFLRQDSSEFMERYRYYLRQTPFMNAKKCERIGAEFMAGRNDKQLSSFFRSYCISAWYFLFFSSEGLSEFSDSYAQ